MLNEQDKIKELFSKNLGNYEAPVNPALWNAVASQIGSAAAVSTVATGVSIVAKVMISVAACTAIVAASYFVFKDYSIEKTAKNEVKISEQKQNDSADSKNENKDSASKRDLKNSKGSGKKEANDLPALSKEQASVNQKELKLPVLLDNKADKARFEEEIVQMKSVPASPRPSVNEVSKKQKEEQAKQGPVKTQPVPAQNLNQNPPLNSTPNPVVKLTASIDKLPNVFSPDGDRINDEFFIEYTGELFDFNLVVMDKENRTIFQSQDPNFKWDGIMMNGESATKGEQRYIYIITARDSNGNKINKYSGLSIR